MRHSRRIREKSVDTTFKSGSQPMIRISTAVIVALLIASPAHAVTVNYSGGNDYDMGAVASGQNGVALSLPGSSSQLFGNEMFVHGSIGNDDRISFTYSLLSNLLSPPLGITAFISPYSSAGLGNSFPKSEILDGVLPFVGAVPYVPYVFALPELAASVAGNSVKLGNETGNPAYFSFIIYNVPAGETGVTTYSVDALPGPVPLP